MPCLKVPHFPLVLNPLHSIVYCFFFTLFGAEWSGPCCLRVFLVESDCHVVTSPTKLVTSSFIRIGVEMQNFIRGQSEESLFLFKQLHRSPSQL